MLNSAEDAHTKSISTFESDEHLQALMQHAVKAKRLQWNTALDQSPRLTGGEAIPSRLGGLWALWPQPAGSPLCGTAGCLAAAHRFAVNVWFGGHNLVTLLVLIVVLRGGCSLHFGEQQRPR